MRTVADGATTACSVAASKRVERGAGGGSREEIGSDGQAAQVFSEQEGDGHHGILRDSQDTLRAIERALLIQKPLLADTNFDFHMGLSGAAACGMAGAVRVAAIAKVAMMVPNRFIVCSIRPFLS